MRRHGNSSLLAAHAVLAVVGVVALALGLADLVGDGAAIGDPPVALAIAIGGAALACGAVVFGLAELRRARARAAHESHAHDGSGRVQRTRRVRWTRAWPWWAP